MNFCSRIICSKEPICLSLLMHPTEKRWEKRCFDVFSQGLEEMHQELSKDGEDHKLGDVKTTPLDLHTLGLRTSNFCFSIETLYPINLERRFCFCLSLERPPHYHLYEKELLEIWVEICWMLL